MMQREVGEKILAKPGDRKRGALSVCCQYFFDFERVCLVPPEAFLPPPKVESIVLAGKPIHPFQSDQEERGFSRFVHQAFQHPRKTLANNLRGVLDLAETGLELTVRPHQVEHETWRALWAHVQARRAN